MLIKTFRSAWTSASRGSIKQKFSRLRNRIDLLRKKVVVKSHPSKLIMDPATMCNLKCPFCSTGNGDLKLKKELLLPDVFDKIVSNIRVELLSKVHLFNFGEPLLNKHLPRYIKYFADRGVPTIISTNLSVRDYTDDEMAELVTAGLSEVLVSVDGGTQDTYEKYRVGGQLDRVLSNLGRLNEARKRLSRPNPRIIYQMLLNKFNQDQIDLAKQHAARVNADEFRLNENFYVPPELYDIWTADSVKEKYGRKTATVGGRQKSNTGMINTECRQLWDTILVNANGDVLPCCIVDQPAAAVGNLTEQHIDDIWNNEKMRTLRRFVIDPQAPEIHFDNACQHCPHRFCTYGKE